MSAVTSDAKRTTDIRSKWYCRAAIAALLVYVVQSILFSYSYLFFDFPMLKAEEMRTACNAVSFALCVTAMFLKPARPKQWQIALIVVALSAYIVSATNTKMYILLYGLLLLVVIGDVSMEDICKWYGFTMGALVQQYWSACVCVSASACGCTCGTVAAIALERRLLVRYVERACASGSIWSFGSGACT